MTYQRRESVPFLGMDRVETCGKILDTVVAILIDVTKCLLPLVKENVA